MKHINKLAVWVSIGTLALIIITVFYACKPDMGNSGLGALFNPAFTVIPNTTNPNNLTLVNKSSTATIPYWKTSTGVIAQGDSAKVNFVFAGTYSITLYVVGHGGLDSITQQVTIAQNDPTACVGTTLGFIAGCTSKTWKLNPVSGAYKVGPNAPADSSWWGSGASDVTGRACEFNDTYTFSFNAAGTFVYNNGGDFYDDGYMGLKLGTCEPSANYLSNQTPWGSGTFKYLFIPGGGAKNLGQIKLVGLGAHIGLQKVTNDAETTGGPVATSVTYDISSMTHDPAGFDLMELAVHTGGFEWWTFKLRSY